MPNNFKRWLKIKIWFKINKYGEKPKLNEGPRQNPQNWELLLLEKIGEVTEKQIEEFRTLRVKPAYLKHFEELPIEKKMELVALDKLSNEELESLHSRRHMVGLHDVQTKLVYLRIITGRGLKES